MKETRHRAQRNITSNAQVRTGTRSSPKKTLQLMVRHVVNITCLFLSLVVLKTGLWSLLSSTPYSLETVRRVQCIYSIELINSLLGLTPQSFLPSLLQICSRVFVSLYVCSYANKAVTSVMFVAWGFSDSLRFLYYMCPSLKNIRYCASFVLYPLGVLCEVYLMVYKRSLLCVIGVLVYVPGFKYLYGRIKNRVSSCKK
ncbi:hypothetical protein NECID01_0601 [Nematocida sp. AWRm77]|nr:hypothetical protein NECID01_0601 [Nematocida sp. AWRm77]